MTGAPLLVYGGTVDGAPTAVPAGFTGLFAGYAAAVSAPGGPLDGDTVRAYLSRVRQYLAWLAEAAADGDPLTNAPRGTARSATTARTC